MAAAVPLLIQVGVAAGTYVASSLLAPKPKLNPVDKGRYDDIRATTAEEGAFIPLCFGERVRLAGNIIWGTVTREYVTRTPGRTGGKGGSGGGQTATPPTNTFSYKKSFAIMVCGTPVRSYRRISENLEAFYNNVGSDLREDFYEAENYAAGGGAAVVTDGEFSGGRAVRLADAGQYAQIDAYALFTGLHTVVIYYKAASPAQVYLSANGGGETLVSLPATGGVPLTVTATLQLRRGANAVKIRGAAVSCDVDRIYISGTGSPPDPDLTPREVTNLIDPGAIFPADPDNPTSFYNNVQGFDGNGYFEGYTTAGGQARIELFAGVETQPQSAIIVAVEGASETPAFRDVSYFVTEDYLVRDGQLGNFIFEIEPEIQNLDEILLYLYTLDGKVTAADCDFSSEVGRKVSGLVIDHRAPLSETVAALEAWFNFDIVPRGGKIASVRRGGAVATRLYERELRAHVYGEERPVAAVKVTHEDPTDLPGEVDVVYLDPSPSKDFHSGSQNAQKIVGFAFDKETLTFPLVGDADTAHAVGMRYLDARHLASKPGELVCGFGKRYLIPTDIVEVELEDATLYTFRIVQKQADLQGMVRFGVVPERASVYGQGGTGVSGRGGDTLVIRSLANTMLVVADVVAVRQEDFGRLVLYAAACRRGAGRWPGYHLHKKDRNDEFERVDGFHDTATIGVVETASQSAFASGYDPTRSFVVKLYDGVLESRTLTEVLAARVNLALYGKGTRWEVLQFLNAVPQAASAPFVAQYLVTGTVAGVFGSNQHSRNHQDGDLFVLVDSALKSFPVPTADLNQELTFVGQTAGQAFADAEAVSAVSLTLWGASAKPIAASHLRLERADGSNGSPLLVLWDFPSTVFDPTDEQYLVRIISGAEVRRHIVQAHYPEPAQWYKPDVDPSLTATINQALVHISENGTVTSDANSSQLGTVRASQVIYGEGRIRLKLDSRMPPLLLQVASAVIPCEVDTATNEFIAVDHYWLDGEQINFLGGIPTTSPAINGDQYGTGNYFIVNATSDRFQISETAGGAPMDITATGSGQLYFQYTSIPFARFGALMESGAAYVVPELATSLKVRALAGGECVIELKNGRVSYYINDLTTPRYVSGGSPWRHPFSLHAQLGLLDGSPQAAVNVTIEHANPRTFLYTREMQEHDFPGGIPSTVTVTVSRLSAFGAGEEIEATG
ncbi:MAG TPA: phage tail protein [Pyrinomonadaceae bacterium]